MKYELDRLGADNFEALIQSLIRGIAGIPAIIFGDGPDGQREAVIENASFTVNAETTAHGRTIVQAKYKSPDAKEKDWVWLQKNLKSELDGFQNKAEKHPDLIPETYLFFTNLILTPVLDKGLRDKAEKFVLKYKSLIPNIIILGQDDIRTLLENNRDVARSYTSFILPGDVLYEMQDILLAIKNEKLQDLVEYARITFSEDSAIRLEEIGSYSEKSIEIRNVYTDLEAKELNNTKERITKIASYLIETGDHRQKRLPMVNNLSTEEKVTAPKYNIVIIGNAGQGKSTLCKYICQIYRAALLKRFGCGKNEVVKCYTLEESMPQPKCERFPILISLKKYASWVNERKDTDNHSVISYLVNLINGKTCASLKIQDLRRLLSGYSWIFLFDGLDEVPESANRSVVLSQIHTFLEKDLLEANCDCLVVCTSRPQGYDDSFDRRNYNHFSLQDMSKKLCEEYIKKLLYHIEDNSEMREQYYKLLLDALKDPMISKLMTTPLYTAIIVVLVKMGGTPPSKRYDLFNEYCEIIIKRERQKQTLPKINQEYEWIKTLHAYFGFLLQMESDTNSNVAAELSTSRCLKIIEQYLEEEATYDNQILSQTIYNAITKRLTFLSEVYNENHECCVVFPLRSIQEYFAAEWFVCFDDENCLSDALEIISTSVYWRNVYLFIAGFFSKNASRKNINETFFRICQRNNGDINQIDPEMKNADAFSISKQGARLALELLRDNLFTRRRDQIRYLNTIFPLLDWKGNGIRLAQDLSHLPEKTADQFFADSIIPRIQNKMSGEDVSFFFLWIRSTSGNVEANTYLSKIIQYISIPQSQTISRLLSYDFTKFSEIVINTLYDWITEKYFTDFTNDYFGESCYWKFIHHYCYIHPNKQLDERLVRQILYRVFKNGKPIEYEKEFSYIASKSDVLQVIFKNDKAMISKPSRLIARSKSGKFGLRYMPISGYSENDALAEASRLFFSLKINELAWLCAFLNCPSYGNLSALIKEYYILPLNYRKGFRETFYPLHWILRDLGDQLEIETTEEDTINKINAEAFSNCLSIDEKIVSLIQEGNIKQITRADYWKLIDGSYHVQLTPDEAMDILQHFERNDYSGGLLSFVASGSRLWSSIPPVMAEFCLSILDLLVETDDGINLAIKAFTTVALQDLVLKPVKYPCGRPHTWIFHVDEDSNINEVISRIDYIAKMGDDYLQAYALIPSLVLRTNQPMALKMNAEDIRRYFKMIISLDNDLAKLGFVLRILFFPIEEDIKPELKQVLLDLLTTEEYSIYFAWLVRFFSMDGLLVIYELLSEKRLDTVRENLESSYTKEILTRIENEPVDQNALSNLSEQAHSTWHLGM